MVIFSPTSLPNSNFTTNNTSRFAHRRVQKNHTKNNQGWGISGAKNNAGIWNRILNNLQYKYTTEQSQQKKSGYQSEVYWGAIDSSFRYYRLSILSHLYIESLKFEKVYHDEKQWDMLERDNWKVLGEASQALGVRERVIEVLKEFRN